MRWTDKFDSFALNMSDCHCLSLQGGVIGMTLCACMWHTSGVDRIAMDRQILFFYIVTYVWLSSAATVISRSVCYMQVVCSVHRRAQILRGVSLVESQLYEQECIFFRMGY